MWVLQQEVLGAPAVSSTDLIPTGFCSQKLWGLIFLALEPWAAGPGVVGLGLLAPKYPSRIFIHHMWLWDKPTPHFHPFYLSKWIWFL